MVLAAYERRGVDCLDDFIGMFAFAVWDTHEQELFAARDRFGVKPLHWSLGPRGGLLLSSEIKGLHAAGIPRRPNTATWADYLAHGIYEGPSRTFWEGIQQVPAGHTLRWTADAIRVDRWYDLAVRVGDALDRRPEAEVMEEYVALLEESVRLRFRADVPVGVNLSGGLDSSLLLSLVQRVQGPGSAVAAYSFASGDPAYDETPWVRRMLADTHHPLVVATLRPDQVPDLSQRLQQVQDEPFGGIPTLAYANLFTKARERGTIVLLDGQGMDEQWAGYDYYRRTLEAHRETIRIQGSKELPTRVGTLRPEFAELATGKSRRAPFPDPLRNAQLEDIERTKLARALRFNDRASMASSTELREPFLDHRMVELALKQPAERKLAKRAGKVLLRRIAEALVPKELRTAPKRPVQTPQREWLRGPLSSWVDGHIRRATTQGFSADWFDPEAVQREWAHFRAGHSDNSFYVWQWISASLLQ